MVKLDRRGIPAAVLNGKVPQFISVYRLYRARFTQELMRQINRAFWAKAKGGTDELGTKWKPLAPATHAYKPFSPMERGTFRLGGKLNRGLLTPAQDKLWRQIFASLLRRFGKKGEPDPEKLAAAIAWNILKGKGARTLAGLHRITDINIRTGALVSATRSGTVSNNRYYAPQKQKVLITPRSIRVTFDIPYYQDVQKVRPVIPPDMTFWIVNAHESVINEARVLYDNLRNSPRRNTQAITKRTTTRNQGNRNRNPTRRQGPR